MVCVPISQQNGTSVSVLVGFLKRKFNLGFVLGNPGPVWECAWILRWGLCIHECVCVCVRTRGCNEGEFQALPSENHLEKFKSP